MAKCRDYERHTDCPHFHKVTDPDEKVQVGTSMKPPAAALLLLLQDRAC